MSSCAQINFPGTEEPSAHSSPMLRQLGTFLGEAEDRDEVWWSEHG